MRGYFGIGVEGISKEQNVGTIARSAHAFGASFFFAIAPAVDIEALRVSDTADSFDHVPYHQYDSVAAMQLPQECTLVGVELIEESVELPSFRHPTRAAYVLGPEMGSLSPEMVARCDHVVQIPMKFCVNVGVAGALVMYDRMISMGRFAERPVRPGGPLHKLEAPKHNIRRKVRTKRK
ncbi:MAG: RNA methyltransferase [Alphaproteobacteria bacterium]|nr:RNA methyltransferase [Alphaproteobacteria bacterium]